ncbi:RNA polymerase sigma factor [Phytohabitans sp. LJ34]|uniref:RNA polymerase sigma factor n=1 Tax=Phytohabitans sp. LJ34 TaxID=3452217 RepID=UPI003F8909E0
MSTVNRADRTAWLAACLDRARVGDQTALNDIVMVLNPLLWRVVRDQGLGVEEAADVVQTTWMEFLRRMDEIRSPQALAAWLVTAARREAWHVRGRARREMADPHTVLDEVPDPQLPLDERLLSDERDRSLWRHLQQLTPRCRELLRIVAHVERPNYDAVAEALAMPRGSIGPTRGRCLAKLRELLLADPLWRER